MTLLSAIGAIAAAYILGFTSGWALHVRLRAREETDLSSGLLFGACIGLGWNGEGEPPRTIRREARRLLGKAVKNSGFQSKE